MGPIQAAVVVIVVALLLGHRSKDKMVLNVNANVDEVGAAVGALVLEKSKEAIATAGRFTLALSGGSLPKVRGANTFDDIIDRDPARLHADPCGWGWLGIL